jgi:hypothetical protein
MTQSGICKKSSNLLLITTAILVRKDGEEFP